MQCSICNHPMGSAPVWQKPGLSVVRCPNCGFYAADLAEWQYPYVEHDYYGEIDPAVVSPERPYVRHRLRQICRYIKHGRAVDLGCGLGETAIALARAGFETHGVEESENAIAFLRNNFTEAHWHNTRIEPFLEVTAGTFDVITLFHVLEHIPRPRAVCKMLTDALCSRGLLVVEVPDVSGGQARLRGRKWQHWLPHHVNYFNLATLSRILVLVGLRYAGMEVKYHLTFPQGIVWRDAIHGMLAHLGLHDIITTYWLKRR